MIESGKEIRRLGAGAGNMEAAAGEIVDFFYESFAGAESKERCNALVRCFKTHAFGELPAGLQGQARRQVEGVEPGAATRCLVLLASRGEEPVWNGGRGPERFQVALLPTMKMVEEASMVTRLIQQMGLEVEHAAGATEDLLVDLEEWSFEGFPVNGAQGSEYVPAPESFVMRHGVWSVLGMEELLPSGELFVVALFSKRRITRETAAMFRPLALSVKLVLLPFAGGRVFATE
jgi:hypothetical protein